MRFADYLGQERLLADLRAALAREQIGHAYLFIGPEGSGRRTLAWLLAQAMLCEAPADPPCDGCRSCLLVKAGTHPDLEMVEADGATIRIEQLRALRARVALKPLLGRRRVFLLAEMEKMSEAAANAFLLTLEDPPPGVVFLGWAKAGEPLLPTILSRFQTARLQPLPPAVLAAALTARGYEPARASWAAEEARGLPGAALHMLEDWSGDDEEENDLAGLFCRGDLPGLLQATEALAKMDRGQIDERLRRLERKLHDEILARTARRAAPVSSLAELNTGAVWRLHARTAAAGEALRANANTRLLLDVLALAFYAERCRDVRAQAEGGHPPCQG